MVEGCVDGIAIFYGLFSIKSEGAFLQVFHVLS